VNALAQEVLGFLERHVVLEESVHRAQRKVRGIALDGVGDLYKTTRNKHRKKEKKKKQTRLARYLGERPQIVNPVEFGASGVIVAGDEDVYRLWCASEGLCELGTYKVGDGGRAQLNIVCDAVELDVFLDVLGKLRARRQRHCWGAP